VLASTSSFTFRETTGPNHVSYKCSALFFKKKYEAFAKKNKPCQMVTNNKLIIKTRSQLTPSTEAFELLKHVGFVTRIHW